MAKSNEDIKPEETETPSSVNEDDIAADSAESGKSGDDKFLAFTRKVTDSTEKVISGSYTKTRDFVASSGFEPRFFIKLFDSLIDWSKRKFPPETYNTISSFLIGAGHWAVMLAAILSVFFGISAAIKLSTWVYVGYGLGFAALLAILQYTADRFLDAGDALIDASPSTLRSAAFPDCFALLAEAAGLLIFLSFMLSAHVIGQWSLIWVGLGIWCLCDAMAYIAINPELINIKLQDDVRAGEEAIGILSFFVKTLIRIVPIAFGAGTLIGLIGLLFGTFSLMRSGIMAAGLGSIKLIVLCTCLPLLSYLVFAFYNLILDVLRAILILPRAVKDNS